ncbi:hypothetical protein BGZ63DRAFT_221617 [Mariannaea sp. PMI_226]|nr:hypothetical protein BGZ63DRAFT_221617 [Mariannaea sp. PMI_226]
MHLVRATYTTLTRVPNEPVRSFLFFLALAALLFFSSPLFCQMNGTTASNTIHILLLGPPFSSVPFSVGSWMRAFGCACVGGNSISGASKSMRAAPGIYWMRPSDG